MYHPSPCIPVPNGCCPRSWPRGKFLLVSRVLGVGVVNLLNGNRIEKMFFFVTFVFELSALSHALQSHMLCLCLVLYLSGDGKDSQFIRERERGDMTLLAQFDLFFCLCLFEYWLKNCLCLFSVVFILGKIITQSHTTIFLSNEAFLSRNVI